MSTAAPLVPAEVDLRDFAFMPLDVSRLRDSDLASDETPESCWAAVLLWCASWHQVPAASIPDNEQWIAKTAGYASRGKIDATWKKVRDGALRGWVKCSDGRLYHPVVAEKANDAWKSKLEQRWRTEAGRVKKHNQRHKLEGDFAVLMPDFDVWMSLGCPQGQLLHVPGDIPAISPGTTTTCPRGQTGNVPRDNHHMSPGTDRQCPQGNTIQETVKGQGQGQGLVNPSVSPDGDTAGKPATLTPDDIIFGYGVPLLVNSGTPEKQARSFLGGLRKAYGDQALIDKLRDCLREKPIQPLEWLAAALPPKGSGPPGSRHSGFEKIDYRAGVAQDGRL